MQHVDHQTFVAMGAEMQRTTGYTRSSRPTSTSRTATGTTGCTARCTATRSRSRSSGGGFYPPDEFIPGEARRNWEAAIFVASIADCPTKIVGVNCS